MTTQQKQFVEAAIQEISALRRENEILRAKVSVIDTFNLALHAEPPRGYPMQVDINYHLGEMLKQESHASEISPEE